MASCHTHAAHQTIFPQKPQKPQNFLTQDFLPQMARMGTDQEGMASLPYPRRHQTIFPQKPQNPQKFLTQDILPQIAQIRRVWHPCHTHADTKLSPTEATETTEVSDTRYSTTDCTDVHRLGGYGIPAIPTQPQKYLPTETTEPTEVSDARYSTTDCTDVHRLGGYGILPYPRRHQTIFPQNPTQPNHLCASVRICGRLFSTRNFCEFREFRGRSLRNQTICGHLCASVGGVATQRGHGGMPCPLMSLFCGCTVCLVGALGDKCTP